jgi:hypothetical protein
MKDVWTMFLTRVWVLEAIFFLSIFLLHSIEASPGAHPASYPMGTRSSFHGVKQLGCKADHSLPFSAEVKNGGTIPPLPNTSFYHIIPE